jgi:hypothetical protein
MMHWSAYGAGEIREKHDVMEEAAALGKHLASIRMQQA